MVVPPVREPRGEHPHPMPGAPAPIPRLRVSSSRPSGYFRMKGAARGADPIRARPRPPTRESDTDMGFRTPGIGDRLRAAIGDGLLEQEPLRHHTTFRVGGP